MTSSKSQESITRKAEKISLVGEFRVSSLRKFLASLHGAVSDAGHQDLELDFSGATYVDQQFMLPALPIICRYREQDDISFDLTLPKQSAAKKIFINADWAHFIAPETYQRLAKPHENNVSARRFETSDEQYQCVDDIISVLINILDSKRDPKQLVAIEWALSEITDNVLSHAESPVGGFVQAQGRPERQDPYVEFLVADAGVGIPSSLNETRNHEWALKRSIMEGVTRNSNSNAGNGLFGTYRAAMISGGWFSLYSQNAQLVHLEDKNIITSRSTIPYTGTFLTCRIMVNKNNLLEDALMFGGREQEPVSMYVERKYGDGDALVFHMKTECTSVGSRQSGRQAKTKIDNMIAISEGSPIEFDFDDVLLISSSFADEVFGRLFSDLGAMRFMQMVKFKNVDPIVASLIDRAISQRTALDTNNNGK